MVSDSLYKYFPDHIFSRCRLQNSFYSVVGKMGFAQNGPGSSSSQGSFQYQFSPVPVPGTSRQIIGVGAVGRDHIPYSGNIQHLSGNAGKRPSRDGNHFDPCADGICKSSSGRRRELFLSCQKRAVKIYSDQPYLSVHFQSFLPVYMIRRLPHCGYSGH